jgi:hypothetical protein
VSSLADLTGSGWHGTAELWLDPLGDQAVRSDCTMAIEPDLIRYTWSHEGQAHRGSIALRADGADFTDTFHQAEPMPCGHVPDARGLVQVVGRYGPDMEWGWRIALALRDSTDELVLQMTNVCPWGEEVRAVRMICERTA